MTCLRSFKLQKFHIAHLISSLIWKFQISNKQDLKWDVQFQLCIKPTGFLVDNYEVRRAKGLKLVKTKAALDFLKNNTSSTTASEGIILIK